MEEYLKAAELLATCPPERVDLVRETLRRGGIDVPDTPVGPEILRPSFEPDRQRKDQHKNSAVTRIDTESAEILRALHRQTGMTMILLASQLIKEGARIMEGGERDGTA